MKKSKSLVMAFIVALFWGILGANAQFRKTINTETANGVTSSKNAVYDDNGDAETFTIEIKNVNNVNMAYTIGEGVTLNNGDAVTIEEENRVILKLHSKSNRDVSKPIINITFSYTKTPDKEPIYSVMALSGETT